MSAEEHGAPLARDVLLEPRLDETTPEELIGWVVTSASYPFQSRVSALRSAVEEDRKRLARRGRPQNLTAAGRSLDRSRRKAIEALVHRFVRELGEGLAEGVADLSNDEAQTAGAWGPPPEWAAPVAWLVVGPDRWRALARRLEAALATSTEVVYAQLWLAWLLEPVTPSSLLDAILPAAVKELEDLLAALLRVAATLYPEGLAIDDRQIKLRDLRAVGSVELAEMEVASAAAAALIGEGIERWSVFLERWPGLPLREMVADWDAVIEAFIRRNAIVHAAGRVDGEYVRRLPKSIPAPVRGSSLHCSHEYLLGVLDRVLAAGSALPLLIFQKLRPNSVSMSTAVSSVVTQLERHRYADAEALASVYLKALPDLPDEDQEILRVNIWMARREQGVSVADDVRKWAPADGDPRWELARACLLVDRKRTQLALEDLRGSGGTPAEVETWPLVVDMTRRFPELLPVFRQRPKPRPRGKKRRRR